jgi:DNA-binding transcriptional ArsR family regulator
MTTRSGGDTDRVVELTFGLADEQYPFVGISSAETCRVELVRMLPREEEYAEYFSVTDADPDRVLEHARTVESVDPVPIYRDESGGLFELTVSGDCPAVALADRGAVPNRIVGADGEGTIVAEVPPPYDASAIVGGFLSEHPSATLLRKRQKATATPVFSATELERVLDDRLTDRQQSVLQAAYEAGYYERPREVTGEQLAEALGITSATFSQHIRAAERTLLSIAYEEDGLGTDRDPDR